MTKKVNNEKKYRRLFYFASLVLAAVLLWHVNNDVYRLIDLQDKEITIEAKMDTIQAKTLTIEQLVTRVGELEQELKKKDHEVGKLKTTIKTLKRMIDAKKLNDAIVIDSLPIIKGPDGETISIGDGHRSSN